MSNTKSNTQRKWKPSNKYDKYAQKNANKIRRQLDWLQENGAPKKKLNDSDGK